MMLVLSNSREVPTGFTFQQARTVGDNYVSRYPGQVFVSPVLTPVIEEEASYQTDVRSLSAIGAALEHMESVRCVMPHALGWALGVLKRG